MSFLDAIRYRFRTLLRRGAHQRELEEEFRFHLEVEEMQQRHAGLPANEAHHASRRSFGNVSYYQQEVRRTGGMERLDAVRRDLRLAIRRLLRAPGFTAASVLTLALGIGGVTAIGTVVHAVLLRPLPYPEPGRLVGVWQAVTKAGIEQAEMSDAEIFTFRRLARATEHLGAYYGTEVNLSDADAPERVPAARVSAGFFGALQVAPLHGRAITEADDQPGGPPVVVLSEGLWRRKFGAVPDVVGRVLHIDGQAHQVIGVMPSRLALPQGDVQLWIPLALDPANAAVTSANFTVIARLRPGFSREAAAADLQRALDRIPELYPLACCGFSTQQWLELAGPKVEVHRLRDDVVGDIGRVLWVLLGTAGFVLLVAGANVANLFLVRAEARQREMAVRVALGSGRAGVVAQFAGEGLVLAGVGAAIGLGLTAVAIRLLARSGAVRIPRLGEVAVNGTTLALAAILTVLVGLGCSLLPIRRFRAGSVAPLLRSGGRGATGGRDRQRARQILVVAQVALAFALLAGSGLLARTFRELRAVRPGFNPSNVLALRVALPAATYGRAADVARFYQQVGERLAALPGVRAAGAASTVPLRPGGSGNNSLWVEDHPDADIAQSNVEIVFTSGDYFRALEIPVLAGRILDRLDPDRAVDEVVISAGLARREWSDPTGRAAVGRRIRLAPTAPWMTVMGVVGDVRSESLDHPPQPTVYLPMNSSWVYAFPLATRVLDLLLPRAMGVVIEARGNPASLAREAEAAIHALDPSLPVYDVRPMASVVTASLARTTFTGWMLGGAAGVALLLGIVGIYGVVAYTVSLRSREIGVRLALGARPIEVDLMLVRQGMIVAGLGIAAGMVLTLLLTGSLRALLFGVGPNDPLTLGLVALVLAGATLLATWVPARRAGRMDPALVLAGE